MRSRRARRIATRRCAPAVAAFAAARCRNAREERARQLLGSGSKQSARGRAIFPEPVRPAAGSSGDRRRRLFLRHGVAVLRSHRGRWTRPRNRAHPFDPRVVREAARSGRRVFAFGRAATFFGAQGLSFERATVAGPSFAQWLSTLPRGTVIAGAAAYSAVPFEFSAIDRHQSAATMPRNHPFAAFALAAPGSAHVEREGDDALSLPVDRGTLPAASPPFLAHSASQPTNAVRGSSSPAARSPTSTKVSYWASSTPTARSGGRSSSRRASPLRVEPEAAIYEFKAESPCVEITTDRWTDIAPVLSTGSWLATVPEVGSVTIESELPASSVGPNAGIDEMLAAGVARPVSRTPNADGTVTLVTELTRNVYGRPLFRMAVDNPPSQARARVRSGGKESTVTICAHRPPPLFAADSDRAAVRPDFESEAYFGSGWRDSERTPTGRVRRAEVAPRCSCRSLPVTATSSRSTSREHRRASTRRSTARWLGRVSSASERRVMSCCRPGSCATA